MATIRPCIKAFIDDFVRSEFCQNWTADNENQGYGSRLDRFTRCQDSAEHSAGGSTHQEIIQDQRNAIEVYLRSREVHPSGNDLSRIETMMDAYFNDLELWHDRNGSLFQEIG